MAEWSARRTRNPAVPGSSPALATSWDLFHGTPEFKSSATLVNSQLVCLRPVGILNNVMFDLNYLFQLFEWHACKLACVAKCMSTINKHLTFDIFAF